MQIILLSGGSGKRLWPLSNNIRSKQFIRLLPTEYGEKESMLQRVVRQLKEAGMSDSVTIATSGLQCDMIINQLGNKVSVVTEPERRDTFPAIALASSYLAWEKKCDMDEVVVVMPCDSFTESGYFKTVLLMVDAVEKNRADLVLMGIKPTSPSSKYGYIVPKREKMEGPLYPVARFTEKPNAEIADKLISEGAFWNGGVFAFRLGYMMNIVDKYTWTDIFAEVRSRYSEFPKISFDYEVVEKAKSVAVVEFDGLWKDLGTWNALTDELRDHTIGDVMMDDSSENTYVINELGIPIMCMGLQDLIVAASYDGILISERNRSENIKSFADCLVRDPMFEERRWGEYKIIDVMNLLDGSEVQTRLLTIDAGKNTSYHSLYYRDKVLTCIDGEGELVLDGIATKIGRGDVFSIKRRMKHAVKALTTLRFVEVQSGIFLEGDSERSD